MSSIQDFYTDRSVFITGATGFLGKVLLEKLLYSCPEIRRIFVLIRPKKKLTTNDRLEQMLDSKMFDKIRQTQPSFREKVVVMDGDIIRPGLGLSEADRQRLVDEVSIVFHCAATVKFDEALRLAIRMNVLGVRQMIEVCRQIKDLRAFVHVSTAYANCQRSDVDEIVYTPPVQPQKVIDITEWMDDDVLNGMTSQLVAPLPNTYTFTKGLAESLLLDERGELPCCIVRPSIVGASWKHPFPGWVDNYNGPSGLLAAIGKGMLRVMMGNKDGAADIIPVDICVNLIIAAAWNTAVEKPSHVPVYNSTSGSINKVTWGMLERMSYHTYIETPMDNPVRVPDPKFTRSRLYRFVHVYMDHYLPAWILDIIARLSGGKARLMQLQRRLWPSVENLEYFTSREWDFSSSNVTQLATLLNEEDENEFNFDISLVDWNTYLKNYCLGVKYYLLKDDHTEVHKARRQMSQLMWMNRVFQVVVTLIGFRYFMAHLKAFREFVYFMIAASINISKKMAQLVTSRTTGFL